MRLEELRRMTEADVDRLIIQELTPLLELTGDHDVLRRAQERLLHNG